MTSNLVLICFLLKPPLLEVVKDVSLMLENYYRAMGGLPMCFGHMNDQNRPSYRDTTQKQALGPNKPMPTDQDAPIYHSHVLPAFATYRSNAFLSKNLSKRLLNASIVADSTTTSGISFHISTTL